MCIITLCKVSVKEPYEATLIFALIMRNNIRNTTFYSYKISNPVVNETIFSPPNNTKYLAPS